DTIEAIIERNRQLLSGDDMLVINGFFFLHYDKHVQSILLKENTGKISLKCADGRGIYFLSRENVPLSWENIVFDEYTENDLTITPLDAVKDIYDLNMMMVLGGAAEKYIMPSYNNEEGVFIGQNVEIMRECDISKPVILGNNIQLKNFSKIGPGAIIGDNTLVDSNTTIENSVIYGDSYIGSELEINRKIIYKRRIIDPETGEVLDIVDHFLVSEINNRFFKEFFTVMLHFITALIMLVCMLPLYILLRPFAGKPDVECEFWADKSGAHRIKIHLFSSSKPKLFRKLFIKFSLDKYRLILLALLGRIGLVGNRMIPATNEDLQFIAELQHYHTAVFSFSGMLGHDDDEFQSRIDELYYSHHSNLILDIKIIVQSLVFRLFRHINGK
ncbi:MAG: hypothetical protein WC071_05980, partial [Victivallaceae bacterium]